MDLALDTVSSCEEQHKTLSEGETIVFTEYASRMKKTEATNKYGESKGTYLIVGTITYEQVGRRQTQQQSSCTWC